MTFSIKIEDATFTKYVTKAMPYSDLASLFLLLGNDAASSSKNYVGTRNPATVVGTPSYNTGYCSLSSVNGFESDAIESGSPFTHIIVATQATANIGYCGNWTTGNSANLLNRSTSNLNLAVDGNFRVNTPMGSNGFQLLAGTHDGSTATVYLGSNGSLSKASTPYVGGTVTKSKFRAGANNYGTGTFNAAAVLTFSSALTEAQIAEVYAYLKSLLSSRGISVA